jgi:hypothetical protein
MRLAIDRHKHGHQSERARTLGEMLYTTPPQDRVAFMAGLVMFARTEGGEVRNILTDPRLLTATGPTATGKPRGMRDWTVMTIAQAANAWCRHVTGHGVADVVHKRCDLPEDALTRGIGEAFAPCQLCLGCNGPLSLGPCCDPRRSSG